MNKIISDATPIEKQFYYNIFKGKVLHYRHSNDLLNEAFFNNLQVFLRSRYPRFD